MSKEEAIKSIESGIEILEEEFKKGIDIIRNGRYGYRQYYPFKCHSEFDHR